MPATFVVVPQWQGAVSARAMSHADGAYAIQGDLPASSTHLVEVPVEAGETLGTGVRRYSTLLRVRERVERALADADGTPIVVGGDCGVALAAVAHVAAPDVALVWLDAHPDLNSPESTPSGAFNGMVLRAIAGEGADGLALDADRRIPPERLVLGGIRSVDDGEQEYLDAHGVTVLDVEALASPGALADAVVATGARRVAIHIDLDVLDPASLAGISFPVPFGVEPAALAEAIKTLVARVPLAGASIAGFAPPTPASADDDLPTILRLVGALTSGGAARPAAAPAPASASPSAAASGSPAAEAPASPEAPAPTSPEAAASAPSPDEPSA